MTKNALWLKIDGGRVTAALNDVAAKLEQDTGEAVLDFSGVARIDPKALRALEEMSAIAEAKGVKLLLHGVNVDVYKVLKLMRLTPRFAFLD